MNRGAFVAIIKNDQVLLVRSKTNLNLVDSWSFPRGVVENGESLKAGAHREALEETGVICRVTDLLAETNNHDSDIRVSIFKGEYMSGTVVKDDVEIAEAGWFKIANALELPLAYNSKDVLLALAAQ